MYMYIFRLLWLDLCLMWGHVRRDCPEPQLASGPSPARKLSRGRQGQEAHAAEPVRLAARTDRRLHGAAEGRHGHPERPRGDQHRPRAAARPCRGSARTMLIASWTLGMTVPPFSS